MKPTAMMLALAAAFSTPYVSAEDNVQTASDNPKVETKYELNEIIVRGTPFAQKMGTQRITAKQIRNRPAANGTITDLLHDNPNVQFSGMSGNSDSAGEIAPENVSFHGEKFYNNNWMIDGMSNNDNTNPAGGSHGYLSSTPGGYSPTDLPEGGTQSFWVNSDIIDRVDVYDSNISAKYGQFTGGVVDAKLKDPDLRGSWGGISWRGSRDSWTKYNLEGGDKEEFEKAETFYHQPKFTKNIYSVNINQPLSEKLGVLLSYNRTESSIPYHHDVMNVWTNQKRLSENYVLKGLYRADSGDKLKATFMYSPHESKFYKKNIKNSAFTNKGGGYRFNLEWEHLLENGTVNSYLGYKHTQNKIVHEAQNYYNWSLTSRTRANDYLDWRTNTNFASEGGYGTFSTEKNTWTAKQDYILDDIAWGKAKHNISFGWQADFAQAQYERGKNSYSYTNSTALGSNVCAAGDDSCLSGDQYFYRRTLYPARKVKAGNNHFAAYIEDKIDMGKWQFTPGLRIDHDRYTRNTDFAPRFTASYDMFGNDNTRLFGGLNRYYSDSMLSYKLRESIGLNTMQCKTTGTNCNARNASYTADWTDISSSTGTHYLHNTNVKTPRSDEFNLGLRQVVGNSEWTLKYVHRSGKNQLAYDTLTIDGTRYRALNNNGNSNSNGITVTGNLLKPWKFKYAEVDLSGGLSYGRNRTNVRSYDDTGEDAGTPDIVDGKLTYQGNATIRQDYSNPWRAFANIGVHIPKWRLDWSTRLNYTSGYSAWDSKGMVVCPAYSVSVCGDYSGAATLYEKVKYKDIFTMDWRFVYKQPVYKNQALVVSVDVLNVLNAKAKTRGSTSSNASSRASYKLGRQFWLGAKYTW